LAKKFHLNFIIISNYLISALSYVKTMASKMLPVLPFKICRKGDNETPDKK
jgi:hypothetical protein